MFLKSHLLESNHFLFQINKKLIKKNCYLSLFLFINIENIYLIGSFAQWR